MNRFGISGAHKSGKTTLAKHVASKWRMKYVDMRLSDVLRAFGASPNEIIPFADRLNIQQNMVKHCINLLDEADTNYITDRTFIDVAAYTLSYMPHAVSDLESETVKLIINQCYQAQSAFFDKLIVVGNGFEPPKAPDAHEKAAYSWAWNFQLQAIIKGLVLNVNMKCPVSFIGDQISGLSARNDKIDTIIAEAQRDAALERLIH